MRLRATRTTCCSRFGAVRGVPLFTVTTQVYILCTSFSHSSSTPFPPPCTSLTRTAAPDATFSRGQSALHLAVAANCSLALIETVCAAAPAAAAHASASGELPLHAALRAMEWSVSGFYVPLHCMRILLTI